MTSTNRRGWSDDSRMSGVSNPPFNRRSPSSCGAPHSRRHRSGGRAASPRFMSRGGATVATSGSARSVPAHEYKPAARHSRLRWRSGRQPPVRRALRPLLGRTASSRRATASRSARISASPRAAASCAARASASPPRGGFLSEREQVLTAHRVVQPQRPVARPHMQRQPQYLAAQRRLSPRQPSPLPFDVPTPDQPEP